MREILFRGKRIDNGEWVYGYYARKGADKESFRHYICVSTFSSDYRSNYTYPFYLYDYEVNPTTVGQYTGLTANGKKIFEEDIIRANHDGAVGVVRFGEYMSPSDPGNTRHIGYYVDWQGKDKDFLRADLGYWASRSDVEVIGNIHDNPELLPEMLKGANNHDD